MDQEKISRAISFNFNLQAPGYAVDSLRMNTESDDVGLASNSSAEIFSSFQNHLARAGCNLQPTALMHTAAPPRPVRHMIATRLYVLLLRELLLNLQLKHTSIRHRGRLSPPAAPSIPGRSCDPGGGPAAAAMPMLQQLQASNGGQCHEFRPVVITDNERVLQ